MPIKGKRPARWPIASCVSARSWMMLLDLTRLILREEFHQAHHILLFQTCKARTSHHPQEIEGHSAVSDGSLVGSLPWKGGCLLHWCYRQRLLNRKHFIYCFVQDEIFNALSFYDDAFKSRNLRFSWACAHIFACKKMRQALPNFHDFEMQDRHQDPVQWTSEAGAGTLFFLSFTTFLSPFRLGGTFSIMHTRCTVKNLLF